MSTEHPSYDLGEVLRYNGWLDEALEYYRKAVALDPRDGKAQTALGNLLKSMGRLDEAVTYFRNAIRKDSSDVWAHVNLGKSLKHAGLLGEAHRHYQQALALAEDLGMRPLQAHCHHGLGTLYAKAGQWEQVRVELSRAIEMYRAMEMTFWLPQAETTLAQVV